MLQPTPDDSPYLPHHNSPIPAADCTDEKLSAFIVALFDCEFSTRSFLQWMEQADFPLSRIEPHERMRLLTLCHMAGIETPQWLRLYDFDRAGILEAQAGDAGSDEILQRNHALQDMIYQSLLSGMHRSDPALPVFENLMTLQDGGRGDLITSALAQANQSLNPYITNHQRQRIYAHNCTTGNCHPEQGYGYWPRSLPADFAFDEALADAEALFSRVCGEFTQDRDTESVRSRLLKLCVLGDENRYWTGTAATHAYVLQQVSAFIPKNIGELDLPDSIDGVRAAVRRLLDLDRRVMAKDIVSQGRVLLDLYLHYARLPQPSAERYPRELAIATTVAQQMRRSKAKWPVTVMGRGTREVSAYQAFKALAKSALDGRPGPIDPSLRVLLCSAASMALWVETEEGMGTFSAVAEHGSAKVRRTEFFARIPKQLKAYSAHTVVRILQRFHEELLANTPPNPLNPR